MATTLKVTINKEPVKNADARELLKALVTTQTPGADTPYNALHNVRGKDGKTLEPESVIAMFESMRGPSDVVEVYEDDRLTGRSTFGKIVKYCQLCLDRENWKPETFGVRKVKESSGGFELE